MLTCFSKQFFGVECPGCGIQRSALSMLRGDVLESIALYPALIPFIVFSVVGIMSLFKTFKISVKWVLTLAIITTVIMLAQYLLKITGNAPWYYEAAANFQP